MTSDWILEVLTDLKVYARSKGMLVLADQLDDALLVAATEIASQREKAAHADHQAGGNGSRSHRAPAGETA